MGGRGPPPTPGTVLRMRGSPLAKGREKETAHVPMERPSCPKFVPADGRKIWKHLIPLLEAAGLLARLDRYALARYCVTLAYYERTLASLERMEAGGGIDVLNEGGFMVETPAMKRLERFDAALSRHERTLGMTPSARASLRGAVKPAKQKPTGPAGYFERRG